MGAWIETVHEQNQPPQVLVAPYMGAWIETLRFQKFLSYLLVAPYMGAWIETGVDIFDLRQSIGRTLHGCVD